MPRRTPHCVRMVLQRHPHPESAQEAAEYYLTSREVVPLYACQAAYTCLFAPLGKALSGHSAAEVEQAITLARAQFETYMALAQGHYHLSMASPPHPVTPAIESPKPEPESEAEPKILTLSDRNGHRHLNEADQEKDEELLDLNEESL